MSRATRARDQFSCEYAAPDAFSCGARSRMGFIWKNGTVKRARCVFA